MIDKSAITGLILAGGRGSRMGGLDKGLQNFHGRPMAWHALRRLGAQVGTLSINANRNLAAYQSMGVPVWPDRSGDFAGPLAGFAAGLAHCQTDYLVTVPCDSPLFPLDLVERLARALREADADIAMAATRVGGALQPQPVFCLLKTSLRASLDPLLQSGQGKISTWIEQQAFVAVPFDDTHAFAGANTKTELAQLQS